MQRNPRLERTLWQIVGALLACALIAWAFRGVHFADVWSMVGRIGPLGAILLLLPQLASAAAETWGWRLALMADGARFLSLLRVRMATDSATCLPAGVLLAESLKVPLLVKGVGLSVPGAVSAIAARKYLLLTSQAVYILLAVALGWKALEQASTSLLGASYLPVVLAIAGVVVALAGTGVRVLLSQGGVARRLRTLLARLPIPAVRRAVTVHAERFHETDHRLQRFFALSWSSEAGITAYFVVGWLFEALETFVILRLLGVELDFFAVLSFEVGLSLVRSLVFIVPAGLGVQDAGYVLFLRALGVPDAATLGAAFSLIKRTKELAWAAFGFGLLTLPQVLSSREKHSEALSDVRDL